MKRNRVGGAVALTLAVGLAFTGCTSGPKNLPEGMPGDIPVAQGEVANQVSVPEKGNWSFSVEVADAKAQREALDKLTADGWEIVGEHAGDEQSTYALTSGTRNASVLFTEVEGKPVVVYNIIDTAQVAGD